MKYFIADLANIVLRWLRPLGAVVDEMLIPQNQCCSKSLLVGAYLC